MNFVDTGQKHNYTTYYIICSVRIESGHWYNLQIFRDPASVAPAAASSAAAAASGLASWTDLLVARVVTDWRQGAAWLGKGG